MEAEKRSIPEWALAVAACRSQMDAWIREAMEIEWPIPYRGGTDEFTFMMPWVPHYLLTDDAVIKQFMFDMRDRWLEWTRTNFHHGYFKSEAEEHHQTENYNRFLARLWTIDEADEVNVRLIEHFAHHLGNWVLGIPEWYDWENHRFLNRWIGTLTVGYPAGDHNDPGFFRYLVLLVQAYLATGERRYLDLCLDYADGWCDLLEATPEDAPLPWKVGPDWRAIEPPSHPSLYMTGGFVSAMLDLFLLTGKERYPAQVKRVLNACMAHDRDRVESSGIVSSHLSSYRLIANDTDFDEGVIASADAMVERPLPTGLKAWGDPPRMQFAWTYDETPSPETSAASPALLALAYQVTGKESYINKSLQLAARRVELARPVGDNSRTHGCANGSTMGVVLTNAFPSFYLATLGMTGLCQRGVGHHKPLVLYRSPNGRPGLPEPVAALFEFTSLDERRVRLYNFGEDMVTVQVVGCDGLMLHSEEGVPYAIRRRGRRPLPYPTPPWQPVAHGMFRLPPWTEMRVSLEARDNSA